MTYIIDSGFAYAAIIVQNSKVVKTAPIFKYMKDWSFSKVKKYCGERGWKILKG